MRTIEVSDEVYEKLQRVARQRATSVEAYLGEIADGDDVSRLFTPEFIAEQHRIADETRSEVGLTVEEVWANLEAHKAARTAARATAGP